MGQGQPRATIGINLIVLNQLTLHIKFQGSQPSDSEEDDVLSFFLPHMAMGPKLFMWSGHFEHISGSPYCQDAAYEI